MNENLLFIASVIKKNTIIVFVLRGYFMIESGSMIKIDYTAKIAETDARGDKPPHDRD